MQMENLFVAIGANLNQNGFPAHFIATGIVALADGIKHVENAVSRQNADRSN